MNPLQYVNLKIRRSWNSVFLNPLSTRFFDRISPTGPLGARGERMAERFLLKLGYTILHRGYRDDIGEIDLVAVDDRTIVFIEVKTRASDRAGNPCEAVDQNKREKICRTALSYQKRYQLTECRLRFDVISIVWPIERQTPQIQHFRDAFTASERSW